MVEMLTWACDVVDAPSGLFNRHFQPQSRHYNQAKDLSKEQFLDPTSLRDTFRMTLHPKRITFKNKQNQWKSKRDIVLEIKSIRGNGPCLTKNVWRVMVGFRARAVPTDMKYR